MEPTGNEGHPRADTQGRGTHTDLGDIAACKRSRGWRRPRVYLPGQSGAFRRWGVRTTHLVLHHFLAAGKDVGAAASWGGGDNACAWNEFFTSHDAAIKARGAKNRIVRLRMHRGNGKSTNGIEVPANAVGPRTNLR